jgi:hypothetical protein
MAKDPALLNRQLRRETTMFETGSTALGGSRTADNLQDIADTSSFDVGMLSNLLMGRWGAAASQMAPKLAGTNEATRGLMARALLSNDPKTALAAAVNSGLIKDARRKGLAALIESAGRAGVNQ